jgi:hypothetical protein
MIGSYASIKLTKMPDKSHPAFASVGKKYAIFLYKKLL